MKIVYYIKYNRGHVPSQKTSGIIERKSEAGLLAECVLHIAPIKVPGIRLVPPILYVLLGVVVNGFAVTKGVVHFGKNRVKGSGFGGHNLDHVMHPGSRFGIGTGKLANGAGRAVGFPKFITGIAVDIPFFHPRVVGWGMAFIGWLVIHGDGF